MKRQEACCPKCGGRVGFHYVVRVKRIGKWGTTEHEDDASVFPQFALCLECEGRTRLTSAERPPLELSPHSSDLRPEDMDLAEAVNDLARHGAAGDPIQWRAEKTIPSGLCSLMPDTTKAKSIRIKYWGPNGLIRHGGTLCGMVKDRRTGGNLR